MKFLEYFPRLSNFFVIHGKVVNRKWNFHLPENMSLAFLMSRIPLWLRLLQTTWLGGKTFVSINKMFCSKEQDCKFISIDKLNLWMRSFLIFEKNKSFHSLLYGAEKRHRGKASIWFWIIGVGAVVTEVHWRKTKFIAKRTIQIIIKSGMSFREGKFVLLIHQWREHKTLGRYQVSECRWIINKLQQRAMTFSWRKGKRIKFLFLLFIARFRYNWQYIVINLAIDELFAIT